MKNKYRNLKAQYLAVFLSAGLVTIAAALLL